MKKIFSSLLVLCLMVCVATGCGGADGGEADQSGGDSAKKTPEGQQAESGEKPQVKTTPIKCENGYFVITPEQLRDNINAESDTHIIPEKYTTISSDTIDMHQFPVTDDVKVVLFEKKEDKAINMISVIQTTQDTTQNSIANVTFDLVSSYLASVCNPDVETAGVDASILISKVRDGAASDDHAVSYKDVVMLFQEKDGKDWFSCVSVSNKNSSDQDTSQPSGSDPSDADTPERLSEYTFSAGNYYVGEDIPQGRYDAVWVSGRGNCFASGMSETFGNTSEHQIQEYKNVELKSGDKVEVHGTLTIKFISK